MRAIIREGIVAGFIGATSVAAWFFIIDMLRGTPFQTPAILGRAFFNLFPDGPRTGGDLAMVLGYTVVHFLAFFAAGLLVTAIVHWAQTEPSVLAGALILFVVFEVAFHGLLGMFGAIPVLGVLAWYNVAIGNLIAALTMGTYLWRAHPELKGELETALSGSDSR